MGSPQDSAPGEPSWFVCHTRPRCEKQFARLCLRETWLHELPLVTSVRRYGRQTKRFSKPLFPGYVFAQLPADNRARIHQGDHLARLIPVDNQKRFLEQLEAVRRLVASGLELTVRPLLQRGTRVRITGGPLWGVEGKVEDPEHPRGVIVEMDVLRQGVLVPISPDYLEPLP